MRQLLLAAIRFYQRYVSPYKGFSCAYRVQTGRGSCSAFGYRAVRRYGVFTGLGLIRARTHLCGEVHQHFTAHSAAQSAALQRLNAQRGACDLSCDLPSCDGNCGKALDVAECACDLEDLRRSCCSRNSRGCFLTEQFSCGCFKSGRTQRRRREGQQRYVHIPPNSWRRQASSGGEAT